MRSGGKFLSGLQSGKTAVLTVIGVVAVVVALGVSTYWMKNRPRAEKKAPVARIPLVETEKFVAGTHRVIIPGMGTVMPAEEVNVAVQVSGKIVEMNPDLIPGGYVPAGECLARIDGRDYELALREAEAEVRQAEKELKLELAQQKIAGREYEMFLEAARGEPGAAAEDVNTELILRVPHLESATAALQAATARLEKAKLSLQRTVATVPFNAVILSREVARGSYVIPGTPLATVAKADSYWLEVPVPVDRLKWLCLPSASNPGSRVRMYHPSAWGEGKFREGRVLRIYPAVEQEGMMARVLVVVDDPRCLKPENDGEPVLLLNAYVRVEMEGREIRNAVRLPREYLREGDSVWVLTSENTLAIRTVTIAAGDADRVYVIAGLATGDRIVTSDIPAAVQGMDLQAIGDNGGVSETGDGVK